jgi:hypothetical protein
LDFLDVEVYIEDFSRVNVLSNLISDESVIRNNRVLYSIEKECIVSIITQSEGLQKVY